MPNLVHASKKKCHIWSFANFWVWVGEIYVCVQYYDKEYLVSSMGRMWGPFVCCITLPLLLLPYLVSQSEIRHIIKYYLNKLNQWNIFGILYMCTALEGMYYQRHFQGNIDFNTVNIHLPRDGFLKFPLVPEKFSFSLRKSFGASGNLLVVGYA